MRKDSVKLRKKLKRAIQNKRRVMLSNGVCLLHNNAILHMTNTTKQLLDSLGWKVLNQAPIPLIWRL